MASDDVVCSVCKSSAGISTTCFVCDAKKWLERKHRIATLERERDEAREKGHEDRRKAHDLLNENLELRGQLAALKALCGEADENLPMLPNLADLKKRLRAAKGE